MTTTLVAQAMAQIYAHIEAGDWVQAEAACQQVLLLDPLNADAHHLAGHAASQLGQPELALNWWQRAVALAPAHAQYRYNLAVALFEAGRQNEAALQYQACLRQEPQHRDALWNYGEMLRLAEHFALAVDHLQRFAAAGGQYAALYHRLAVSYGVLGRDAEAEACFKRELNAVSDAPADALTHWEYALFLLSRGRFAEGFAQYRRRFEAGGRNGVFCHVFDIPAYQGQLSAGDTVLVHGEQGLGDEMMFASIVPALLADAQRAGARVVLAVKPALARLFAYSFPQAIVRSHRVGGPIAELSDLGPIPWQLPIGDLAFFYRREQSDFAAAPVGYLKADPLRSAWYAQHLAALEPRAAVRAPRLQVGLMWGSNPAAVNDKFVRWTQQRSIPVERFARLAHLLPDVRFISLQNVERGAEAALAPALDIFDLSSLQTDFYETAALVANLDLVISVDTSVSHLAGAMDKDTWVPLMKHCDWRHGLTREQSLWYPKTRYFRQQVRGEWDAVLDAIEQALLERLADTPAPVVGSNV